MTIEETETQRSLGTFPRSKSWSVSHQYLFSLTLKFKLLTTMTCASNVRPFYLEFFLVNKSIINGFKELLWIVLMYYIIT